ncbi:hypothetical protein AMJ80_00535 [bacterium SM23_31]|nr:MAG: hypothetical protein AMJ80_00535 [bacterium SM23_31]
MKNALEMFALKGFDAVSVDDIARKANCNKAMIYYHFSSKKALYQLILKDVLKDMLKQMNPIFKSALQPAEKLRLVLSAFIGRYNERDEFIRLMLREILSKGKNLKGESKNLMKTFFLCTQKVIKEGQESGEILQGNPILLYRMLIGSIIFYFISRPLPKTILNIDSTETEETYSENKRIILDILMRGIHNDSK